MTVEDAGHRATAIAALADREYETAADAYTRAAWRILADPRPDQSGLEPDAKGWVGHGLAALAVAAVAYRVAGQADRATHRGVEGVAIARDLTNVLTEPPQQACLKEFVADFRVVADLDDSDTTDAAAEAYEEAADAYAAAADAYHEAAAEIDNPQAWATTPLFEAAAAPIKQVARTTNNGEIAVTWDDLHGSDPSQPGAFLAHRARYKRQRFAGFLDAALDASSLAAPRGTTAYNTDEHRCPNCESRDVNWIGDSVCCLRCSTPMDHC